MKQVSPDDRLVSVVIPAFNSAGSLGEAIDSALQQTWKDVELIIVDNNSTDETEEVMSRYRESRIYFHRISNQGSIAKSRNYGARHSQGSFLAFLDSDDIWEADKLERQIGHLADQDVVCVASNVIPIGNRVRFVNHLEFQGTESSRDFSQVDALKGNPVVTSSAVVRRRDFEAVGGFDESPTFIACEDWDLWIRLAGLGKIRVLATPLVRYRVAAGAKRDTRKVTLNSLEVVKRNARADMPAAALRQALGNCYISIGRAHLEFADRAGVGYYLQALRMATGTRARLRCLWGLMLFALPAGLRRAAIRAGYRAYSRLRPAGAAR